MSATARVTETDEPPVRRLYRSADGRWLGGVARGLAGHLGLPVVWVRVLFVMLSFSNGLGIVLYAVFWIVVPLGVGGRSAPAPSSRPRRTGAADSASPTAARSSRSSR